MPILNSPKETFAYGKKLAAKLKGGDVVLLSGELGAGKTALVKGIAKGLGIKNKITSPTFTLMNVYEVKSPKSEAKPRTEPRSGSGTGVQSLVHIDTYRLKDEKELLEIGIEDYLGQPDTICAIEWPEKIKELLKNTALRAKITTIVLEHGDNPHQRRIEVS